MRVLVSRISVKQAVGGAELSARDICRSLIKLGHEPFYMTNLRSSPAVKGLPKKYLLYIPSIYTNFSILNKVVKPLNLAFLFFYYFYTVMRVKPDILNPQSRNDQVAATIISKAFGVPVIWRDPGDLRPQLSHRINNPLQKMNRSIQRASILKADAIFTLNKDDKDYLVENMPNLDPRNIYIIKSNIMFEDYSVKNKKNHQEIIVGCVSRLDEHKGVQYAIEAFKKLKEKYNNISLLIAGDGVYKKELKSLARGIKNITFIGHVSDVSDVFNNIDIFVQPAKFEGWGRNVKEAKYFGKAIVGSEVGGIREQIIHNQTGLLFNIGNVDLLYKHLESLVGDYSKRSELSQNARKSAIEEGDWLKTVKDEVIPLFNKEIVNSKRKINNENTN